MRFADSMGQTTTGERVVGVTIDLNAVNIYVV